MEIPIELFDLILFYSDWNTLQQFKLVNYYFNNFAKKEIRKRLKSKYPFGEKNARISVQINDISIDSISVCLGNKITIPEERYAFSWIRNLLNSWFIYSFANCNFNITGKLFKSIIRIMNRKLIEKNGDCIDENRQTLIFRLENNIYVLEEIT